MQILGPSTAPGEACRMVTFTPSYRQDLLGNMKSRLNEETNGGKSRGVVMIYFSCEPGKTYGVVLIFFYGW
jgi:hypothetical protein